MGFVVSLDVKPATGFVVAPFDAEGAEWDALVAGMADAKFSHLFGWRSIVEDVLGHRTHYMAARDGDGQIQALLPLVNVKSRLFGNFLVSMPFLNDGGPIGTYEGREALAQWAIQEANRSGADSLELRSRSQIPGPIPTVTRKLTVLKEMASDSEEFWKTGIRSKLRSQIRRPMKEGLTTHFGPELIDEFYGVYARRMRDLGTPVLPRSFFHALIERFPDQVIVASVRQGDMALAVGCGFLWQGEFEITWASSLVEYNRLSPNMLLYWTLMEHTIQKGADVFNFGRCSEGSPTHRFKTQWGGTNHPLPWGLYSPQDAAPPSGESASPILRTGQAMWKRLPLPVAAVLGPRLARLMP